MGAWTTRIFDDDGVEDILAEYKILLGYGVSPEEAYRKIYDYFAKDFIGQDDEDVFWLGIALYQWKNGILLEEVKENALRCIENEEYLERWKDSGKKVYEKRKEILNTFKDKLLHEVNPTKKKFPKCPTHYREKTNLKVGDLLAYIIYEPGEVTKSKDPFYSRLYKKVKELDGKVVLLRVVNVLKKPVTKLYPELDYCSWANMMLYDWCGDEIPDETIIKNLQFKPIVIDYIDKKRRIVSNVTLEKSDNKNEFGEMIYLGNEKSFREDIPDIYLRNSGSPMEFYSSFNQSLAKTFLELEGEEVWYYEEDTKF